MALPELPDDRRAQPRRYGPADPTAAPRSPGRPVPPYEGRGPGGPPPRATAARQPLDDEPTESIPPVVDPPSSEAPTARPVGNARRRRQLGTSPTERPASSYSAPSASGRSTKPGRRRRPTFWRELPILVVVALVLTFLIQTFLAKVYVIPSGSMETTLHGCTGCVNDRVLVDKITYRFRDPQPGDVVVFRGPDSWRSEFTVEEPTNALLRGLQGLGSLIGLAPPDEKDFVKRVIAVGGQTVACCDPRNRVLVDEQPLDEPYIYYLPDAGPARQAPFGPVTVPAGELWMMGDSRNNSADSRVPGHGAVPISNVIGLARMIVMPFDRFGRIASVDPHANAVGMAAGSGSELPPATLALVAAVPVLRRPRQERFLVPPVWRRRGT
ncbi:MAG TPA: signal peptidase I [Pseudonocardia sp.]|nr:signal peptidase I [Pseudonocardia sp.]